MRLIIKILIPVVLCCFFVNCSRKADDFKSFFDGHEIVYPGVVNKVKTASGDLRVMLSWNPSPDPSISKYVIYWNNNNDSLVVSAVSHTATDTVHVLIDHLNEYVYSFIIYSYDEAGNRSIPLEVDNVKVYGPLYRSTLLNRAYNATSPYVLGDPAGVTLYFNTPDTINITTHIKYVNTGGDTTMKDLAPGDGSIFLSDYKPGTRVLYQSSFIPLTGAIDTFLTPHYDTFPRIFAYVPCNKGLFKEAHMPNDVGVYDASSTTISRLWDGSNGPQGYPNIYHSDGNHPLPHHLTFDLGQVYDNLGRIEETGRDCCNNPDDLEIWGIADTTGAVTTLPGNDPGWKAQSIAKGWVLLKEALRSDDGKAPMKFDLIDNPPPVRFIRIRVIHVTSGDGTYSNMSELTLWNKQ